MVPKKDDDVGCFKDEVCESHFLSLKSHDPLPARAEWDSTSGRACCVGGLHLETFLWGTVTKLCLSVLHSQ